MPAGQVVRLVGRTLEVQGQVPELERVAGSRSGVVSVSAVQDDAVEATPGGMTPGAVTPGERKNNYNCDSW